MNKALIVLAVFAALLTGSIAVHAAPPQTMNYQGYLTDSAGTPLSGSRKITFSIYTINAGSVPLWTEVHPKVSVVRGQFSVTLGEGTPAVPLNLPFDRPYWLGVTIDLEKSEMTPRQPLTTTPYAFRAKIADSVPGLSITTAGLADRAVTDVKIGGTITAAKLDLSGVVKKTGDSMSGPLAVAGDISVSGAASGVVYPDGTRQTTALLKQSWDKIIPVAQRFVDALNGEAVLDRETGLVWAKTPDSTIRNWQDAMNSCTWLSLGGRLGWRLPTVEELGTLVDTSNPGSPKLPVGHPFLNAKPGFYWTSSTYASIPANAWYVRFDSGLVGSDSKTYFSYVWPVRGGQQGI